MRSGIIEPTGQGVSRAVWAGHLSMASTDRRSDLIVSGTSHASCSEPSSSRVFPSFLCNAAVFYGRAAVYISSSRRRSSSFTFSEIGGLQKRNIVSIRNGITYGSLRGLERNKSVRLTRVRNTIVARGMRRPRRRRRSRSDRDRIRSPLVSSSLTSTDWNAGVSPATPRERRQPLGYRDARTFSCFALMQAGRLRSSPLTWLAFTDPNAVRIPHRLPFSSRISYPNSLIFNFPETI